VAGNAVFLRTGKGSSGADGSRDSIAGMEVPDSVVAEASSVFSPEELTRLVYLIIEINAWNRLAITTGFPRPGTYEPTES
jgi:hypothetical protein